MLDAQSAAAGPGNGQEQPGKYILRLFISGAGPNSTRAVNNIRRICQEHLKDNYHLEIVDVYQQPLIALSEQVIALPLLIKLAPQPVRRLIGDMSDTKKVLNGLGIIPGE